MKFDVLKLLSFKESGDSETLLLEDGGVRSSGLLISGLRVIIYSIILLFALFYQSSQPEFINLSLLGPLYFSLVGLFFLQSIVFLYPNILSKNDLIAFGFFLLDGLVLTGLLFTTKVHFALFVFLYLINVILCGFSCKKTEVFILASVTSIMYTFLLVTQETSSGLTFYFSLLMNNFAFFLTAFISSYLSEYIKKLGEVVVEKGDSLSRVQDFNASIVENISSGLMVIDEFSIVHFCNKRGVDILEVEEGKLLGQSIESFFPVVSDLILRSLKNGVKRPKLQRRLETEIENFGGENLILEVSLSEIIQNDIDDSGKKFVILFNDLSKVKKMEFAMRQSEKLAAVGQLAAGIAHEIRNPLASISGSVQMLESMGDEPDRSRLMKIVLREIDRLNNLISEFMDFVRPNQRPTKEISLLAVVRDTIELIAMNKDLHKNGVSPVSFIEDSLNLLENAKDIRVKGEESKLKQALMNILINACHAVEKEDEPKVGVLLEVKEQQVFLKIQDNGCGMKESDRKKIFEPFHTTKAKGTGLGLAVTHKIFEDHNAKIFVKSEQGIGTEFLIEFPAISDENKV